MVMAMEKKQPKYTELVNWIQEQIASTNLVIGKSNLDGIAVLKQNIFYPLYRLREDVPIHISCNYFAE